MTAKKPLTYRDAGVDIDAGDALVERIKPAARRTLRPEVLGGLGGFGALVELPSRYNQPVLVSGTDGVGTKLKLAIDSGRHGSIGIDLVGMCVNDVVVQGAEPLFFLDYYATGKLDVEQATQVTANTGTHIGALWTSTGTQLASVTFTNESASGWQQANFSQPVEVRANTTFVASYLAPKGHYSADAQYFANGGAGAGRSSFQSTASSGNGVYYTGRAWRSRRRVQRYELLG